MDYYYYFFFISEIQCEITFLIPFFVVAEHSKYLHPKSSPNFLPYIYINYIFKKDFNINYIR